MVKGQSDINLIHVCDISEAHDANCIPNLVIQDFRLQKCCTRHKLDKILSHLSNKIWFNLSGNSDRHQVMMKDPINFMARLAKKKKTDSRVLEIFCPLLFLEENIVVLTFISIAKYYNCGCPLHILVVTTL